MVRLDRIVTRAGDRGTTMLAGGVRVRKTHPRIEALGSIDELSAALGVAAVASTAGNRALIESIQRDLFVLGADAAAPGPRRALRATPEMVKRIDIEAVRRARRLPPLQGFVVPGGTRSAALLHWARVVCRRAERRAAAANLGPAALSYLNRLSDLLFVMARAAAVRPRVWEVPGRPRR